jgi:hypothetical protein
VHAVPKRPKDRVAPPDPFTAGPARKHVPYAFVLDELAGLGVHTKPLFGCVGVYVDEMIVLALREKEAAPEDNGLWIATTAEHHASLRALLPEMRSIGVLGPGVTGWQIVPADSVDFEDAALRVCGLIQAGDPRIGKIPKSRRKMPRPTKAERAPAKRGR